MLQHVTQASQDTADAPGQEGSRQFVFFNSESLTNTSAIFSVGTNPWYIQAANLADGETVTFQTVTGNGSTAVFADCYIGGFPIQLTNTNNKIRLDYAGRYRLVFAGADVSTINVIGYPAEMTHEPVMGLVQALANIGNNAIEGVAPIVVTGTGTNVDPYQISITLATNIQEENGLPAINVISAGVLKHVISAVAAEGSCRVGVPPGIPPVGFNNAIVGHFAASSANVDACVLIGTSVAGSATLNNSVVIGPGAGSSSIGTRNIFIGEGCGDNSTTSRSVLILPQSAVSYNSDSLVLIGDNAGAIINNIESVCVGSNAGNGNSGINNTCIGYHSADSSNISGSVCVGHNAGELCTAASIIAIGESSAQQSDQFNLGIAVGTQAGQNSNYLLASIAIGDQAAQNVDYTAQHPPLPAPQTFSDGIFIGKGAGKNETFYDVIVIGQDTSGQLNATQNHQIILGTAAQTQLVTAGSIIQGGVIGPSDERLKKDVAPVKSVLAQVEKLNPVSFTWDRQAVHQGNIPLNPEDFDKKHYGLIAQELEKVFPEMIQTVNRGFGEYKFVHYDRLIPILLASVKELTEKNYVLEERLSKLEKKK